MKFPDDAPFVAMVVGACLIGAVLVIAITQAAGELCALHFFSLC